MNNVLLIIDLQNNFINNYAKDIPNKVKELINSQKYTNIIFTKFINNKDNNFYNILNYKGCINENDKKIVIDTTNYKVIEKTTYSAYNIELKNYLNSINFNSIHICGIDTDACVLSTTISLFDNGYNVKVLKNACMSHSGKKYHFIALKILEKLIGKDNII